MVILFPCYQKLAESQLSPTHASTKRSRPIRICCINYYDQNCTVAVVHCLVSIGCAVVCRSAMQWSCEMMKKLKSDHHIIYSFKSTLTKRKVKKVKD